MTTFWSATGGRRSELGMLRPHLKTNRIVIVNRQAMSASLVDQFKLVIQPFS